MSISKLEDDLHQCKCLLDKAFKDYTSRTKSQRRLVNRHDCFFPKGLPLDR